MRTWMAVIFSAVAVSCSAAPAFAYDVSYTPLSSPTTLVCPANATLNGTMCYCNVGYNMSGGQCVKIEAPPLAQFDIYDDVLMTVTVNDTMSCEQLAITAPVDKDMCVRYKATALSQRTQWKSIPRPVTAVGGIANPWAPSSQQTLVNTSQAVPPIAPLPPPPPPAATTTSAATTTNEKMVDAPPTETTDPESEKIGEALKKVLDDRYKSKPAAASTSAVPDAAAPTPEQPAPSGPPPELVELSKKMAAAEAEAAAAPPPPPAAAAQTAQAAQAVETPAEPQDFITRLIGFFRWLF